MSKVYTGTGDDGFSYIPAFKKRLPKDHEVFEAIGTLDELNSFIGLIISKVENSSKLKNLAYELIWIQKMLFRIGESITSSKCKIRDDDLTELEKLIEKYSKDVGYVEGFILPGGHQLASLLHIVRSICRRCERRIVKLMRLYGGLVDPIIVKFVNRLSSYFFIVALYVNKYMGIGEHKLEET